MKDHWCVVVERNGEHVVTIESRMLAGREISDEDEAVIEIAARHLLAFIGCSNPPERAEWSTGEPQGHSHHWNLQAPPKHQEP